MASREGRDKGRGEPPMDTREKEMRRKDRAQQKRKENQRRKKGRQK